MTVRMTELPQQEKQWALYSHLSPLVSSFVGPLVIWQMKRGEMPFAGNEAKEALNFQLSIFLYALLSALLVVVLVGVFMLAAIYVFNIAMILMAAAKANQGVAYRYPLTIRFVK